MSEKTTETETEEPTDALTDAPAEEPTDVEKPTRPMETTTPAMLEWANAEYMALVRDRLPERFYRESHWRLFGTALVARIAGVFDTMTLLSASGRRSELLVLLRTLYEHVAMFAWIAEDPDVRVNAWVSGSGNALRQLHLDAEPHGIPILSEIDVEQTEGTEALPSLPERVAAADDRWTPRFTRAAERADVVPLPSLRALYTAVLRVGLPPAVALTETMDSVLGASEYPHTVDIEKEPDLTYPALAVPLLGIALCVCSDQFGWPDQTNVLLVNDAFVRQDEPSEDA